MKPFLSVVTIAAVAFVLGWLAPSPVLADDEPFVMQADGGSTVTSLDAGATVTVDLGQHGGCYNLAMRCEGAQQTRYALCAAVPCAVGQANQLLDADQTIDIPVNCNANALAVGAKRYLSLTTDDAGLPSCKAQHSPF